MIWLSVALAGGGPVSTQVLYAADDPDSHALALYYASARQLPDNRLCGVAGSFEPTISWDDFDALIRQPWEACLRDDTDVLVVVKGLPYRVDLPDFTASLEGVLQVGRGTVDDLEVAGQGQATWDGHAYASIKNPAVAYRGYISSDFSLSNPTESYYTTTSGLVRQKWPRGFRRDRYWRDPPVYLDGELLVVGRLDGWTFDDATALVDRALASEEATPEGSWLCMQAADTARGPRDPECEFALRKLAELGVDTTWLDTHDSELSGHSVLAYLTGAANLKGAIDGITYAPGAYADNITSYGAVPNNFCEDCGESQTSIARFVRAGASATHGTVNEPLNNVFPNAGVMLMYSQGYSLGESVLYNLRYLYWQNLLLGDPLMTPFDERPTVSVESGVYAGVPVVFAGQHSRGVARMELWMDGELLVKKKGELVEWTFDELGDVQVLVVAVAVGRTLSAPEWPTPDQEINPDTQGWATMSLEVTEPPVEDTADSGLHSGLDTGEAIEEERCGCASGSTAPWSAVPLWALIALGRRTRRVRKDPA